MEVSVANATYAATSETQSEPSPYRLCNSDPLRGNFMAATASWGGGSVRSVRALPTGALPTAKGVGQPQSQLLVRFKVVLVAAKLFSLQFQCTS
jgi:hypothetical protein